MSTSRFLLRALPIALALSSTLGCLEDSVSPAEALRPEVMNFTAGTPVIDRGDGVVLSWEVLRASSISISASPGGVVLAPTAEATGQVTSAALEADTTFTLTAVNDRGETTSSTRVTVETPALRVSSFSATPPFVAIGQPATLAYDVRGATGVKILRGDATLFEAPAAALRSGTFVTPALEEGSHTFTLAITRDAERVTQFAQVAAKQPAAITRFEVTPSLFAGTSTRATVLWAVDNAVGIQLLANGLPVPGFSQGDLESGRATVAVAETTDLELVVSGVPSDVRATARIIQASSEVEPNETAATASPVGVGVVAGTLGALDVDYFAVTVPPGGWVFAETTDGVGGCAVDTTLRLYDGAGLELGGNDDADYDDLCSRVDPRLHTFAANLGAGTYYLRVEGLAGATGAYVLESRVGAPGCGNEIREGQELCDDGNTVTGDGCPATCALELLGAVTTPETTLPIALPANGAGFVRVDVERLGQSLSARLTDDAGACLTGSSLTLLTSAYESIDYTETSPLIGCPELRLPVPTGRAGHVDLLPGTYYLHVHNQETTPKNFQLITSLSVPTCGNGTLETSQGEECDDGNLAAGDGCAAACLIEAEGRISGRDAVQVFSGAINPGNERDRYVVVLGEPGYIEAQTFTPAPEACSPNDDTVLELYEARRLLADNDDQGPGIPCSLIQPRGAADLRPAGVYVVSVRSFADNPIAAYAVRIRVSAIGCGNQRVEPGESCDDGNTRGGDGCSAACVREGAGLLESEPNDRSDLTADVTGVRPASVLLAAGAFQSETDLDTFSIDVTGANRQIVARTHTLAGDTAACANTNTALDLIDAMGRFVVRDDDDGPDLCSALDSIETVPTGLPPGRYYLRVRNVQSVASLPVYFLTLRLE